MHRPMPLPPPPPPNGNKTIYVSFEIRLSSSTATTRTLFARLFFNSLLSLLLLSRFGRCRRHTVWLKNSVFFLSIFALAQYKRLVCCAYDLHETTINSNNDVLFSFIKFLFGIFLLSFLSSCSCSFIVFSAMWPFIVLYVQCSVVSGDANSQHLLHLPFVSHWLRHLLLPRLILSLQLNQDPANACFLSRSSSPFMPLALHLIVNSQMSLEIIVRDWWCLRFVLLLFFFAPFGGEFADTNLPPKNRKWNKYTNVSGSGGVGLPSQSLPND